MSELIKVTLDGARVAADSWTQLTLAQFNEGALDTHCDAPEKRLLPLTVWLEERDALTADAGHPIGVWLDSHEDPEAIAADLDRIAVIAVNFPTFKDGRGYSTAYLLRHRYGYKSELRAIGDIKRDQLFYLRRVGFDAFLLTPGANTSEAIAALSDFSDVYQGSVIPQFPHYASRSAAAHSA